MKYLLDFSKRNSLEYSLYLINTETLATYEVSPLAEIHSAREYLSIEHWISETYEDRYIIEVFLSETPSYDEVISYLKNNYPEVFL